MFRILIANSKGGAGKTMLTSNLAGFFAQNGRCTTLVDCDPQGSSASWCGMRPPHLPIVHCVSSSDPAHGLASGWVLRLPVATEYLLIDTPAGLRSHEMASLIRHADVLLIPIVPSALDLRATLAFLDKLRRLPEIRSGKVHVALVANRIRERTVAARELDAVLQRLTENALIAVRDSQAYVGLASTGCSLFDESKPAQDHIADWQPLLVWLLAKAHALAERASNEPVVPLRPRIASLAQA
ncbi:MAG: ParA family protein [Dokdonella sp.]